MSGRRKPYTEIGIRRVPCFRCGKPSACQWNICADGGRKRGLCQRCDIGLNRTVLKWLRDPEWKAKIDRYANAGEHE